ncbi:MAG: class I tRNA ligase family protein, partial [Bacteroidota bacterium]
GLLYRHETYLHNYPHDWRKGTPLMSYPVESWFVRTTAVKDRLVELNKQINWQPEGIGTGRFGQWLENNVDWALSRNRYWGTPLPIWVSDRDPEYFEVIGSVAELREKAGDQVPEGELDLHRPFVDTLTWPAPDGGTMRRVPELCDVWFDSGAMPFAQWHYPFENQDIFERNFPADFIAEGVDQTRGWFYTLHAIATLVRDDLSYKNVVVNGLLLDEKGEKMSKSKGNAVEPFETIAEHGADPVRWYMMTSSPPWENLKWSERGLTDTKRKFFGTLSNTYSFFATYANVDGFDGSSAPSDVADRPELDRWILSRLASAIAEADASFGEYNPTKAGRAVETFVDDLSNWYIRRSRRRFWKSGDEQDKNDAYHTVLTCLRTVAQLMAPIAPFFAEWLWRSLHANGAEGAADSVHLSDFPTPAAGTHDPDLERRMYLARTIASTVLSLRNEAKLNVRQPLGRILVVTGAGVDQADVEAVRDIVLDEVNVRRVEYVSGSSDLVKKSAKPNFKVLGRRLGKQMKEVNQLVRALGTDAIETYEQAGTLTLALADGTDVVLEAGDLDVTSEGIEGWLVAQQDGVTVALDTQLTDELRREGLAREFVNRVQNMRKTAGFEVTDRIDVTYEASPAVAEAVAEHAGWIRNETLTVTLEQTINPAGGHVERFDVGDETVQIGVRLAS